MIPVKARSIKTCPVCNSTSRELFTKRNYLIRSCQVCGHQFVEFAPAEDHVNQIYDNHYFQGSKLGYRDYLKEGPFHRQRGRWYSQLLKRFDRPGNILDVGAAAGFVLQGFVDGGWQGIGLEPNSRMVAMARQMGIKVMQGTLEQLDPSAPYDLISMIQVIEHLTYPQEALRIAADATRSQGFWLIETGDRQSWTARLRGKHWADYNPPAQLNWFSPSDLNRLTAQYGFSEVARGRPPQWVNVAHAKFHFRHIAPDSPLSGLARVLLSLLPDRLTLPYKAPDRFWILYRKLW